VVKSSYLELCRGFVWLVPIGVVFFFVGGKIYKSTFLQIYNSEILNFVNGVKYPKVVMRFVWYKFFVDKFNLEFGIL
jgi:hypothetical protein